MERDEQGGPWRYRFGEVEFDEARMTLTVGGAVVVIEPRPLQVLAELLRCPNEVVTREELFESVWEGRATVDNVLANAITKLRKALGTPGGACLVNVPRVGYRLVAQVQRLAAAGGPKDRSPDGAGQTAGDLQPGMPVPGREGFQLLHPLGQGSRRNVWLARQAKTGLERVFKFATDADGLQLLKREYTLLRVLHKELGARTDIVAVIDAAFSRSPYHLKCEYGGQDLLAWAGGPDAPLQGMSLPERLALCVQIADAVAAAHGVGVLHKDLKPANVLVQALDQDQDQDQTVEPAREPAVQVPAGAAEGSGPTLAQGAGGGRWQVRLTDFGCGHALDEERLKASGVTLMGLTVAADREGAPSPWSGTPLYWAPELLAGQGATTRSDVYALGLMLFQLVVGDLRRPLSTGWQREVDDELLREDIAAATEGDPQRRLASAGELADRLRRLPQRRDERAVQQAALQAAEQARQERERRRARRPWLAAAAALLLLALGAGGWMFEQNRRALAEARV